MPGRATAPKIIGRIIAKRAQDEADFAEAEGVSVQHIANATEWLTKNFAKQEVVREAAAHAQDIVNREPKPRKPRVTPV